MSPLPRDTKISSPTGILNARTDRLGAGEMAPWGNGACGACLMTQVQSLEPTYRRRREQGPQSCPQTHTHSLRHVHTCAHTQILQKGVDGLVKLFLATKTRILVYFKKNKSESVFMRSTHPALSRGPGSVQDGFFFSVSSSCDFLFPRLLSFCALSFYPRPSVCSLSLSLSHV